MYVVNKDKQFRMFDVHKYEYDDDDDDRPIIRMTGTARVIVSNEFHADA
jgi:hypothetical protein